VPNAFSPNGDNFNPDFGVYLNYEVDIRFNMMIFNRYGEMVFEGHAVNERWDGTYNHVNCPMEVYTWILQAETFENNAFFSGKTIQSGTVTLLR
jgi:gliding motility-associated-like protein